MRPLTAVAGIVWATAMLVIIPAPAAMAGEFHQTSSAVERRPALARFEGLRIDLGGARPRRALLGDRAAWSTAFAIVNNSRRGATS